MRRRNKSSVARRVSRGVSIMDGGFQDVCCQQDAKPPHQLPLKKLFSTLYTKAHNTQTTLSPLQIISGCITAPTKRRGGGERHEATPPLAWAKLISVRQIWVMRGLFRRVGRNSVVLLSLILECSHPSFNNNLTSRCAILLLLATTRDVSSQRRRGREVRTRPRAAASRGACSSA